MFTVSSNFIGSYKLGDNIVNSLATLQMFYECMKKADKAKKPLLYKPAIIWIAAIVEAVLFDLHRRARLHTREGVKGMSPKALKQIQQSKFDEFGRYIESARQHDLLRTDDDEDDLYDDMDALRKLRNRVHIQNTWGHRPADDPEAFTKERLEEAECIAEAVVKRIAKNYTRKKSMSFVQDFEFPWKEHFPEE